MLLAKCMQELQRHGKIDFELVFLVMNPGYNEINKQKIISNAKLLNIPITMFESNIFEVVEKIDDHPCYICARMRRGHLYRKAKELGCNKIALGHNMDDVLETFLLNLLYTGSLSTFAPKSFMDRTKITLIRPLIFLSEKDTRHFVKKYNKSVMPKVCPMDEHTKRETMKEQIFLWQKDIPMVRANLFGAISRNLDGWKK